MRSGLQPEHLKEGEGRPSRQARRGRQGARPVERREDVPVTPLGAAQQPEHRHAEQGQRDTEVPGERVPAGRVVPGRVTCRVTGLTIRTVFVTRRRYARQQARRCAFVAGDLVREAEDAVAQEQRTHEEDSQKTARPTRRAWMCPEHWRAIFRQTKHECQV